MTRKDIYVVGYKKQGNCVYGKEIAGAVSYIDPMTLRVAEQSLRRFSSEGQTAVLYRLVPVKERVVTAEDVSRWMLWIARKVGGKK